MPLQYTPRMYWGTPIVEVQNPDHERIKEALIACAYEAEKKSSAPIESGVSPFLKHGLYESPFNFFQSDVKEVHDLRHFCTQALAEMVFFLHREVNQPKTAMPRINVELFESWVHVTHDGGYHDAHVHSNCSWCGIYYVEIGDATADPPNGCNRFYPPTALVYQDVGTMVCPLSIVHPVPENGKLVLFPSHVQHAGVVYRGKRDRILASFNARVTFSRPGA
jgi:uncharacterized protein (TIGR02466 family)